MKFLDDKFYRLRRLRKSDNLRKMFAETKISVMDFVMPFFVMDGKKTKQPINSMPGIFRYSVDLLVEEIKEIYKLGIPAVLLFGVPNKYSPPIHWGARSPR